MDRAWIDEVLKQLGVRYKLGNMAGEAVELLYRAGRAEFRPSRFIAGGGASGRELELTVDVRVPKDANMAEVDALIAVFEEKSAKPRGFTKTGESSTVMTSESGAESGSVRSMKYQHAAAEPAEAAKQIRAIVESIDIPIVVGIHEAEHVVARDAPKPAAKPKRPSSEPLELWEYQLDGGLLRSLTVVVDPNDRTMRVFERKLMSKKELGEKTKLAQIAKLGIRRRAGAADLIAFRRDGTEFILATGSGSNDFIATAERLAKKIFIPIEEISG